MMISKKRPIICIAVFLLMFLTVISLPNKASASSKDFVIQGNNLVAYKGKSSTVTIPKNVKTIVGLAFYRNPYVKKVIIPDSVKIIDEAAFLYCYDLHTVKLGKSVTKIEKDALYSIFELKSIEIPSSVKTIEEGVFDELLNRDFTIIGKKGSAAEKYAKTYGFKFKSK
ncbi:MAG TPA: leucine-rich repeat domain-containing protein [Clostridiales bacterium]|nr:leucine-rich repeat domain-containing protein [Clostridiales bacterium]